MRAMESKGKAQPVVFSMPNSQCIWNKTGLIESTECVNAFDCPGCSIQKGALDALDEKRAAGGKPGSRKMMNVMPQGKCRHMLSGRISYGLCSFDDCAACPLEQMLEDTCAHPGRERSNVSNSSGYDVARNYYYHRGHTWARVEYGGMVRVGMDDFALRLIGEQDEIETPELGAKVAQGRPAVILRRSGMEAAIASPVDGVVVAINHKVLGRTPVANDAPYEDGWLMMVQPTNLRENIERLLFDAEGCAWIEDEAMTLNAMIAEESRLPLVAAGAATARDVVKEAPELGWDRLVKEFL